MHVSSFKFIFKDGLVLEQNYKRVREKIAAAAKRAGRDPKEVELVAVSKTVEPETVIEMNRLCNHTRFGENRNHELKRKKEAAPNLDFDYIGPLQRNKVRDVVGIASLIHSVDSLRLLRAINNRAKNLGIVQEVLLQVDISGEESKQGFEIEEIKQALLASKEFENTRICGLMTMAPFKAAEEIRWVFNDLRETRELLRVFSEENQLEGVELRHLSMGMSNDFEVAIEEGSTLVRVGSALFSGAE